MKPHKARILAMQAIYQLDLQERSLEELLSFDWIDYKVPEDEKKFASDIIKGVRENLISLDKIIKEYSENWDFTRISYVNKAILRIALYQLIYMKDEIPAKVVIDEAIRLAKEFAEEESSRYINGMLDNYCKKNIKE
ncbi:MAG: transcription antitermination factor NusB [Spirochaetia bacterium]|nr:transcription antitermination factor NusB [Spirochaetia bacterium]